MSQATYTYDAYGNLTASTGTITNPSRFAGQYQDTQSGLYYLRARYYDPASGQFLSRDPAVATTREPYGYIADDPLNGTDPSGLYNCGWHPWDCISPQTPGWNQFVGNITNPQAVGIALVTGFTVGAVAACTLTTICVAAGAALFGGETSAATVAGMPIVASALPKLSNLPAKFGTDEDSLAENGLQNGARYVDTANNNNINCFLSRPDGASVFIRLTLDPRGQQIISAGLNRARDVLNGIARGRFQ